MRATARLMARVAPSDANALLLGEHGVGKEIAARWLHAASARAARPMITVNVGGLSEGVFESELFGHLKGAFTDAKADRIGRFELADKGTIFLDEIANISPGQQARILRVLNTGEFERVGSSRTRQVEARVFSATNADLGAEVAAGRSRGPLYRLNTIEIIPPCAGGHPLLAPSSSIATPHTTGRHCAASGPGMAVLAYGAATCELDHTLGAPCSPTTPRSRWPTPAHRR
jgi:transcriptional regulator with GAF, ATPase, and Fis domain